MLKALGRTPDTGPSVAYHKSQTVESLWKLMEAGSRIESPAFRRHKAAVSRLLTERGPDHENRELNGANNTMSC